MSRVVRIVCDCCGKEIPEASSVALQGQLASFKHYELNAGKPENGIEPKLQSVFEESIK